MVKIIKGEENKIPVRVTSLIDYSGFTAKLEVEGIEKSISDLSKHPKVVLSSSEVEAIGDVNIGTFTVYNADGDVHAVYKLFFQAVDTVPEALSFNVIRITVVSSFEYDWAHTSDSGGGSGSGDGDLSGRVSKLETAMNDKVSIYYDEDSSTIGFTQGYEK